MRLDRFLASAGVGTRSEVKKILKSGAVMVNGIPEKRAETKIHTLCDTVTCHGRRLAYEPFVALMFHQPAGCVTATEDTRHRTVMDYISHDRKKELFPVGRLDIDTEGLLLVINDGDLAHRMLSPKHHVAKTYFVRVRGMLSLADADAFARGIDIGEKNLTLPAKLRILSVGETSEAEVTIYEGRFHQVKRMFAACGHTVLYLKRTAMAGICLDPSLAPGEWRALSAEERGILVSPGKETADKGKLC